MHILFLAPILPALWLAYKAFRSPYPWPVRLFLMLLPIGVSQIYNIQRRLFGSLSGPNVSATILEVQIWAFATMILFFFGLLLVDFGRLCLRIKRFLADKRKAGKESGKITTTDPRLPSRRSFLVKSTVLGMSVAVPTALVSGTGVANAVATPIINAWNVYSPALPEELEGMRLVQLADLHLGPLSRRENITTLIENINDIKPDLVCLCGDLADGSPAWRSADNTPRGRLAELFGRLSATHGVYACTGNHEYYSDYNRWTRIWKAQGVRFLHNSAIALPQKGANLVLGGLDDRVSGTRGTSPFIGMSKDNSHSFRVLLDHRPGSAPANARTGAQLQLSGHTHGGQCPGLSRVIARANGGFVRGWYEVDGMALYVTAGASLWPGFALRLGVPAEAALITLHKGERISHTKAAI